MMEILHLLQMHFQNTLFEQIGFYCSYQMHLNDSEECLQNPQTKKKPPHDNSQTMSGTASPPTDKFVHL